jgi:hypothetical protein
MSDSPSPFKLLIKAHLAMTERYAHLTTAIVPSKSSIKRSQLTQLLYSSSGFCYPHNSLKIR